MPSFDFRGQAAIVTGASRGVGAALAVALAEAGAAVACAARATDAAPLSLPGTIDDTVRRANAAGAAGGGRAIAVPTNLARDEDVVAMVATTVEAFGRLDILVNNAAITFPGDLELPMKRFGLILDVDLRAPLLAIIEARPHLARGGRGRVVNVSSRAALEYFPGMMAYGMAKLAMEHMTISCAAQLAPEGIAVNTFRIDVPVASEGFVMNSPGVDTSDWEPCEVAAEGILWMLSQPASYSGHNESMYEIACREGVMPTVAERRTATPGDRVTPRPS
jgi:NAD(P)-dependent dehydrogenase (short-subunit alcohol dehydrogenase family)